MLSATYDPNRQPTMTTGVLMVPEETMKAMQQEIERLRAESVGMRAANDQLLAALKAARQLIDRAIDD